MITYPDPGTTNQPVWTPETGATSGAQWLTQAAQYLNAEAQRLRCHALIEQVPASGMDEMVASMVEVWKFYSDSEEEQP